MGSHSITPEHSLHVPGGEGYLHAKQSTSASEQLHIRLYM